jgi:hypothetical protein
MAAAGSGKVMVLVSHKLEEVFAIADTLTVLRDGRSVAERSAHVTLDVITSRPVSFTGARVDRLIECDSYTLGTYRRCTGHPHGSRHRPLARAELRICPPFRTAAITRVAVHIDGKIASCTSIAVTTRAVTCAHTRRSAVVDSGGAGVVRALAAREGHGAIGCFGGINDGRAGSKSSRRVPAIRGIDTRCHSAAVQRRR